MATLRLISASLYLRLEGNITVASVPGNSRMHLSQTGQISNLEIKPHTKGQESLLPIRPLMLPQLLTSSSVSPDIGVTVNPDGTGRLTESGINFPTERADSSTLPRYRVSSFPSCQQFSVLPVSQIAIRPISIAPLFIGNHLNLDMSTNPPGRHCDSSFYLRRVILLLGDFDFQ